MNLSVVLLAVCFFIRAVTAAVPSITKDCINDLLPAGSSVFPDTFFVAGRSATTSKVSFATGFTVEYFNTYKIVTVNSTGETYCLYQCGVAPPNPAKLPTDTKFFRIPLAASSVTDTTAVAFMAELGLLDRVKYATQYSVQPCMQKLSQPKSLQGCGLSAEGPTGNATADALNTMLKQQSENVAAVWTFSAVPSGTAVQEKTISFPASADTGTLRRAEWLKYVAVFFNKELEANRRFDAIATSYNSTRDAALEAAGSKKPVVAWASSYFGVVSISLAAYKNQYIKDAGGVPLTLAGVRAAGGKEVQCMDPATYMPGPCAATSDTAQINITAPAGVDALRAILADVDVLVDESYINSTDVALANITALYGLTDPKDATALPFLKSKSVFRLDASVRLPQSEMDSVTLEWYESAVARPDLVLMDLAQAINPAAIKATPQFAYLRNVATAKVSLVTAAQCKALSGCSLQPQPICPYVYRDCDTGALKYVTETLRCGPTCGAPSQGTSTTNATTNATGNSTTITNARNGVAALRPLLLVFLLIVCLIEALIQMF